MISHFSKMTYMGLLLLKFGPLNLKAELKADLQLIELTANWYIFRKNCLRHG